MKYIKTYESFNVNETLDMFTMPSDPIKGSLDVYKELGNYIKTKITDLVKYLGDKYNDFIQKFEELCDIIANAIEKAGDKAQYSFEKVFGHFNITTMRFEDIKKIILDKYGKQLESAIKSQKIGGRRNESHFEQEAGDGGTFTNLPKDSGLVQTFLAILQNILGFNLYTCGGPISYLLSLIFGTMGFTAVISTIVSLCGSIIALGLVFAMRKVVYNLEHGDEEKLATKPLVGDSRFNPDKLKNNKSREINFLQTKTYNSDDATRW